MDFTALFVDVDDFWLNFQNTYHQHLITDGKRHRHCAAQLSVNEMITILIAFQTSNYRTFKHFYMHLLTHHHTDFPQLTSYNRFIQRIGCTTIPLFAYLMTHCRGHVTGISFIDSTPLKVCSNKRTNRHRVFDGIAAVGRSTMGWFFGFKLHLVINECGELLAFTLTSGNVDDRTPVESLTTNLWGKLFGDKGYISQKLFDQLYARSLKLITSVRKNMQNKLLDMQEKILLRKRSLIETINDQLKNVCQIEHTRHRSPANFLVHLMAGLAAYAKQPKKPTIKRDNPTDAIQVMVD
jgi:hypothetical protein